MSDRRPSDSEGEGVRLLRAAARQRSVVAADLFLPEPLRLTDWQRATVRFLLEKLVRAVEDELRTGLADAFAGNDSAFAALSSAHVAIALPLLDGTAALHDPALVAVLVRRAEEHRMSRSGEGGNAALVQLVRHRDRALAADAMAVLVAVSRRFDRFQEPVMARTELAAELQHRLVWTVAAALRRYLIEQHAIAPETADEAIVAAAGRLLAGYDEGDTLEARAMRLARRLRQADRLGDSLIAQIAADGNLPLLLAALAARTGLDYLASWEILHAPGGRGAPLLIKAAGIARDEAASILLALDSATATDDEALVARIDQLDGTSTEAAQRALRIWALDPAYRGAIVRVGAAA